MQINRRAALKSLAAAVMVPCVRLREDIDREAIMAGFCYTDRCLYDIDKPFTVGSLTYATDARWAIRAELSGAAHDGERILPPIERAWKKYWVPQGAFREFELPHWSHASVTPARTWGHCPECGDRRVSYGDCYPPADALNNKNWVLAHDYDIDDNTVRDKSCAVCRGKEWKGPCQIRVLGHLHDYWRLKRILSLPSGRIASAPECLLFVADGFEGVSMGLYE